MRLILSDAKQPLSRLLRDTHPYSKDRLLTQMYTRETCVNQAIYQMRCKWCMRECVHAKSLQLCPTLVTLQTGAHKALLPMGYSRQEYWSGLPCPPPGDLSDPGIEPVSLMSPELAGGFFTISTTWEANIQIYYNPTQSINRYLTF